MRTRCAALLFAATLLGPALYRPALACSKAAGVGVGDCKKPTAGRHKKLTASSVERSLFSRANAARRAAGVRPLRWDARAAKIARAHAKVMARDGSLRHNPKLRTARERRRLGLPRTVGENVGVGPDDVAIHDAFMDSSGHRGQILARDYRTAGFGVVVTRYEVWVSELFVGVGRAGALERVAPRPVTVHRAQPRPAASARVAPAQDEGFGAVEAVGAVGAPAQGAGFPWRAMVPSLVVGAGIALRRRRRRSGWV